MKKFVPWETTYRLHQTHLALGWLALSVCAFGICGLMDDLYPWQYAPHVTAGSTLAMLLLLCHYFLSQRYGLYIDGSRVTVWPPRPFSRHIPHTGVVPVDNITAIYVSRSTTKPKKRHPYSFAVDPDGTQLYALLMVPKSPVSPGDGIHFDALDVICRCTYNQEAVAHLKALNPKIVVLHADCQQEQSYTGGDLKKFVPREHPFHLYTNTMGSVDILLITWGVSLLFRGGRSVALYTGLFGALLILLLHWHYLSAREHGLYIDGELFSRKKFSGTSPPDPRHVIDIQKLKVIRVAKSVHAGGKSNSKEYIKDQDGNQLYSMLFLSVYDPLEMHDPDAEDCYWVGTYRKDVICHCIYDQQVIDYLTTLNPNIRVIPLDGGQPDRPTGPVRGWIKDVHFPGWER